MGLENRERGGPYYYRKEWIGGRCWSVYVASGDLARAYDAAAALARNEAKSRNEISIEEAEVSRLVAQIEAYCDDVTAIMRAHLEQNGYRRHKRGEWRKTRR